MDTIIMAEKASTTQKKPTALQRRSTEDPFIGKIIGHCEIREKINEGGTAYIYKAFNTSFITSRVKTTSALTVLPLPLIRFNADDFLSTHILPLSAICYSSNSASKNLTAESVAIVAIFIPIASPVLYTNRRNRFRPTTHVCTASNVKNRDVDSVISFSLALLRFINARASLA